MRNVSVSLEQLPNMSTKKLLSGGRISGLRKPSPAVAARVERDDIPATSTAAEEPAAEAPIAENTAETSTAEESFAAEKTPASEEAARDSRSRYGRHIKRKRLDSPSDEMFASSTGESGAIETPPVNKTPTKKQKQQSSGGGEEVNATQLENLQYQVELAGNPDVERLSPCEWLVGDLGWAKVGGHPWWPCMVSFDPITGKHTKAQVSGYKYRRSYHVQFFGDEVQRAWVASTTLIRYEGRVNIEKQFQGFIDSASGASQRKAANDRYSTKGFHRPDHQKAVAEAEPALAMGRDERVRNLTFVYEQTDKGNSKTIVQVKPGSSAPAKREKQRHSSADSTSLTDREFTSQSAAVSKLEKIPQQKREPKSGNKATPSPKKNQTEKLFENFCAAERGKLERENPCMDDGAIDQMLINTWDAMTNKHRLQYRQQRHHNFVGSSEVRKLPQVRKKKSKGTELSLNEDSSGEPLNDLVMDLGEDAASLAQSRSSSVSDSAPSVEDIKATDPALEGKAAIPDLSTALDQGSTSETSSISSCSVGAPLEPAPDQRKEQRKDKPCMVCEQWSATAGPMVLCDGGCCSRFHLSCIGLTSVPEPGFRCDKCTSGIHPCFICQKDTLDGGLLHCTKAFCGKYYHKVCLEREHKQPNIYSIARKGLVCPQHVCHSCVKENGSGGKPSLKVTGRVYRCLRCPTAYHTGDYCIAAGSVVLSASYIVCSRHAATRSRQTLINVNWCFLCSAGGNLICCEGCPSAFHTECLGLTEPPDGSYFCEICVRGTEYHYGDIVWVKLGAYRWWPSMVCVPRDLPEKMRNSAHEIGDIPIMFFGSHDYHWANPSRIFRFAEGDKACRDRSSRLARVFQEALLEAYGAFTAWQAEREQRYLKEAEQRSHKPPVYRHLQANRAIGSVSLRPPDTEETPCNCNPDLAVPCGPNSGCINRDLYFECNPKVCRAGERCRNLRFQRLEYAPSEPFRTEDGRGWGLRASADIREGEFVIEYVGEVIDEIEFKRRFRQAQDESETNFYFLTLGNERIIDAGPSGNRSRFMNHSCQPNCTTQKWTVNGNTRIGLFAIQDIPAGKELTFNYNLAIVGADEKTPCRCGAPNCAGFIGEKPLPVVKAPSNGNGDKKRKKRRHSARNGSSHDDFCFRCYEGGELIMCDRRLCTKAYHLACLGLAKTPHGKWECPWHHCDICGKPSSILCDDCPNSYCPVHAVDKYTLLPDGKTVCDEHDLFGPETSGDQSMTASDSTKVEADTSTSVATEGKSTTVAPVEDTAAHQADISSSDTERPDTAKKDKKGESEKIMDSAPEKRAKTSRSQKPSTTGEKETMSGEENSAGSADSMRKSKRSGAEHSKSASTVTKPKPEVLPEAHTFTVDDNKPNEGKHPISPPKKRLKIAAAAATTLPLQTDVAPSGSGASPSLKRRPQRGASLPPSTSPPTSDATQTLSNGAGPSLQVADSNIDKSSVTQGGRTRKSHQKGASPTAT